MFILCQLDENFVLDKMIPKVFEISSMNSLHGMNNSKFTFNLIRYHVSNKFFVSAICITCDNLVELKLDKMYGTCFLEHEYIKFLHSCSRKGDLLAATSCFLDTKHIDYSFGPLKKFALICEQFIAKTEVEISNQLCALRDFGSSIN